MTGETFRELFPQAFRHHANELVARYGAPVYLVGSALTSDHPRDIDVVIVVSDQEFYRFYGKVIGQERKVHHDFEEWEWRRARDRIKQSRHLREWWGHPIDFRVQTEAEFKANEGKPRLRLDNAPDWVFT